MRAFKVREVMKDRTVKILENIKYNHAVKI